MITVFSQSERLASIAFAPGIAMPAPPDPRFAPRPVELCQLAGDWKPAPLPVGMIAEEKIDGIRMLYIDGQLLTREGEPIQFADHLLPEIARLQARFGRPMMLDGEYQEPGGFLDTLSVMGSKGRRAGAGTFHLFDAIPLEEWRRDDCMQPLTARRRLLAVAMEGWAPKHIRLLRQWPVASRSDVERLAADIWARDGEGLMLKDGRSLYRRHRSTAWLKHKRMLALTGTLIEVLSDGAAARVAIEGRKVKVAIPPAMRNRPPAVGMTVQISALEWTKRQALRQGRIADICAE